MRSKLYLIAFGLIVLGLVACRRPDPVVLIDTPIPMAGDWTVVGFFEDDKSLSFGIYVPAGWIAKRGGEDARAPLVITDDWEKYQNKTQDKEAVGIIVSPLTDEGSPEQILDTVAGRLETMLTKRQGEVTVVQQNDQRIAWAEYIGKSVDDGTPLRYLLAVVTKEKHSLFVFTSVLPEQLPGVQPEFEAVIQGITLP